MGLELSLQLRYNPAIICLFIGTVIWLISIFKYFTSHHLRVINVYIVLTFLSAFSTYFDIMASVYDVLRTW